MTSLAHAPLIVLVAAVLAGMTAGLTAGCGSSPTPRFYAINAMSGEAAAPAPANADLGVIVGPVSIPRYLQRPQIVSRTDDSRLRYDEFNRWGGNLESEILRVLGENLGLLLHTDRIAVYPRAASFPATYRVRLDFERFDATRGEELVLKVRWAILPPGGGDAVAVEVSNIRESLDGASVRELVRAHGAALEALSREIAARIEALQAEPESDS